MRKIWKQAAGTLLLNLFCCMILQAQELPIKEFELIPYRAKSGKWGFCDRQKNIKIQPQYDEQITFFNVGYSTVQRGGKWGFLDAGGKEVIPPRYDSPLDFERGFAFIKLNGKFGVINRNGQEIVPPIYDGGGRFVNGYMEIERNGKAGLVDTTGRELLMPQYDRKSIRLDGTGVLRASLAGKDIFLDKSFKEIFRSPYDEIGDFEDKNYALVKHGGKWGLIEVV